MAEKVLRGKSFAFAVRIVKLARYLQEQQREYLISKQLRRCGTAIGAMVREAEYAESRPDFIHKLSIALKEANENEYWLELLLESGYLDERGYHSIHDDLVELLKLLTAIVKTSKNS